MGGNLANVVYPQFVKVDDSMGNLQARAYPAMKHRGEPAASIKNRRPRLRHYGDLKRLLSAIGDGIRCAAYPQDNLATGGVRYNRHASLHVISIVVRHLQPLNPFLNRSLMSKLNLDIIADIRTFGVIKECKKRTEFRSRINRTDSIENSSL